MDRTPASERRVQVAPGRWVRLVEGGDPEGSVVLGMHGMPFSARAFEPHLALARRRGLRWIGYDRPGYYRSTPMPGRRVVDCVADARAVLRTTGADQVSLWGWSAGAPHAAAVAAGLGDRVTSVVLLGTVAPFGAPGLDWYGSMGQLNVDEFRVAARGARALDELIRPQRQELRRATAARLRSAWASILSPPDRQALRGELAEWMLQSAREGLGRSIAGWREDALALVRAWGFDPGRISAPVLCLHGADDRFVGPAHSAFLARRIPRARFRRLGGHGHLSIFSTGMNIAIDWMAEHAPTRRA